MELLLETVTPSPVPQQLIPAELSKSIGLLFPLAPPMAKEVLVFAGSGLLGRHPVRVEGQPPERTALPQSDLDLAAPLHLHRWCEIATAADRINWSQTSVDSPGTQSSFTMTTFLFLSAAVEADSLSA